MKFGTQNVTAIYYGDTLICSGDGGGTPPGEITDFNASDDQILQITFTWTHTVGDEPIVYKLYDSNETLITSGISSPYTAIVNGSYTETFYIKAVNNVGSSVSNTDIGTSLPSSSGIYPPNYEFTENLIDYDGFNWLYNSNEQPPTPPQYNAKLYMDDGTTPYLPNVSQYPKNGVLDLTGAYADTEFIIDPSSEFIITLIYDVNLGTAFKMQTLYYKGDGTADVYDGDQNTPISLSQSDILWNPLTESFKLREGSLIAPPQPAYVDVYVNFDNEGNTVEGSNTITTIDLSDAPADLIDTEGNVTGISFTNISMGTITFGNGESSHASCFGDGNYGLKNYTNTSWSNKGFDIILPEGNFEIAILSSTSNSGTDRNTDITIDGVMKTIDSSIDNTGSHCETWANISGNRTISLTFVEDGGAYINSLHIRKIL